MRNPLHLLQVADTHGKRFLAYRKAGSRTLFVSRAPQLMFDLFLHAIRSRQPLSAILDSMEFEQVDWEALLKSHRLLAPIEHPEAARCWITGTGLTHLGSAAARDAMHTAATDEAGMSDTMKMFRLGLKGGKPKAGEHGVQPEWFYKGNGFHLRGPDQPLPMPAFALDGGEEPELVGIYLIDDAGQPWRIGYTLGNEFSDHLLERQNYLYLAHSKLRACSIGPEIIVAEFPSEIQGVSRIRRDDRIVWEKPWASGADNMSHSFENLEHHHFKYEMFRAPGDLHLHFMGTATLSIQDGFQTRLGDCFEIAAEGFICPLRNRLESASPESTAHQVRALQ